MIKVLYRFLNYNNKLLVSFIPKEDLYIIKKNKVFI